MNENNIGREFGWDDEVTNESTGYVLIDEGDYRFKMVSMERGRHDGSAKIPPCNKAICTLQIIDDNGMVLTEIKHNIFLHSAVEGMISAFFLATGAKKHGEPLNIGKGFSESIGRIGWCHVYVDVWKGTDGADRKSNKIKYFIDPAKAPKPAAAPAPSEPAQASFAGWGPRPNYTQR